MELSDSSFCSACTAAWARVALMVLSSRKRRKVERGLMREDTEFIVGSNEFVVCLGCLLLCSKPLQNLLDQTSSLLFLMTLGVDWECSWTTVRALKIALIPPTTVYFISEVRASQLRSNSMFLAPRVVCNRNISSVHMSEKYRKHCEFVPRALVLPTPSEMHHSESWVKGMLWGTWENHF